MAIDTVDMLAVATHSDLYEATRNKVPGSRAIIRSIDLLIGRNTILYRHVVAETASLQSDSGSNKNFVGTLDDGYRDE